MRNKAFSRRIRS